SELLGVFRIKSVLSVDEGADAAAFLRFSHGVKGKGGLTRRLRSVYLDDAAAGKTADAKRVIKPDRAGGDSVDVDLLAFAEGHDSFVAELGLDGPEGLKDLAVISLVLLLNLFRLFLLVRSFLCHISVVITFQ